MSDNQGDTRDDRSVGDTPTDAGKTFPTNAVVGVVGDPGELTRVREELLAAGLKADILTGERGVERIEHAGGSTRDLKLTRAVQELFGYEVEHTERHTKELEAGHFVVIVESHDDETVDRVRDILAAHGGHFVNYYSRWTSRSLLP